MANYTLEIIIPDKTVAYLNQIGEKVVIVKKDGTLNNLAWITFNPFPNNLISWKNEYGIYASTTKIDKGATIKKACYSQASVKNIYPFEDGIFKSPSPELTYTDNEYGVWNKFNGEDFLTFGLAQDIVANGSTFKGKPISASTVLFNHTASFIPHEKICVFTKSYVDDGSIISTTLSNMIDLDFTEKSNITVKYDEEVGLFVQM